MTRAFGDDQLERELRAILAERAEEVASRARTSTEIAAELAPRLVARSRTRSRSALRVGALVLILLVLAFAVILFGAGRTRPPVKLLLAVQLPLAGEPAAPPIVDAVRLALRDQVDTQGVALTLPADGLFDDSVDGVPNVDRAAANAARIAADRRYVAIVGPFLSFLAESTIPIANAAGLLQCSPTNTAPGLTVGPDAAALRPRPERPSYVRLATTDDAAAVAAARLIVELLDQASVFVVTTVEPWAGGRSEAFVEAFEELGGRVTGRGAIGEGGDGPDSVASMIEESGAASVFFDGPAAEGARVLVALRRDGVELPFVGLDIILDGPRSTTGSFLDVAGASAEHAYGVFPTGADPELGPRLTEDDAAAYGHAPESYILAGAACTTIVLDAIDRIDPASVAGAAAWREAIRTEVTAPGRSYHTAIGTIGFDANGDAVPQRVSVYRGDPTAGDWAFWQLIELRPER
jgi:branched-chain amino acid transport system substrate-binding protein